MGASEPMSVQAGFQVFSHSVSEAVQELRVRRNF